MTKEHTPVEPLSPPTTDDDALPRALTRLVWALWLASVVVLGARLWTGADLTLGGVLRVDGLTAVMWVAVTFFSGVVYSYSRRYMAGDANVDRFFATLAAFTASVLVLVSADHLLVFLAAWTAMGLAMARLIGHVDDWESAHASAALARRYFLGGSGLLALAFGALWWTTGATTVSGVAAAIATLPESVVLAVGGALVLAAMVQSALVPFHRWLLSSMTAPTPASALMHAGFVNAGGVLLVRFAPVVTADDALPLLVVLIGAASALTGKLLKTVQPDVKGALGCSTVGQMSFMLMQAGLGFFAAALTHLVLHGFYKAYHFLSAGGAVAREAPETATERSAERSSSAVTLLVVALTGLVGGGVFALLTGEGTEGGSGLLLVLLVVLTVLQAARDVAARADLPAAIRYAGVPLVALPAIGVYAGVYTVVHGLLAGLPGVGHPEPLTPVHGVVAAAFLVVYLAVETGLYRCSARLYVALLNAARPSAGTLLTDTEDYQ
ncbi:proton-conducting transporter transmembrane domain-containing protein [Halocalculus aciditolerans]|uniref:NADH dehydrogenase n=1 Tax=Halocalculus aciditolerans TaxID=1383812 RepID=A0A830FA43_9EURY|nr:proton-conducting transporter membrane subunit [Halocalculus aciditolerans]GGL54136.1 NADH dehydrogenase [Halocalculus aciditolerans]